MLAWSHIWSVLSLYVCYKVEHTSVNRNMGESPSFGSLRWAFLANKMSVNHVNAIMEAIWYRSSI